MAAMVYKGVVFEDSGATLMARVMGASATAIQQADITSVTRNIYNRLSATLIGTTALTVSGVVFDTLQTDARWTKDGTGYNFRDSIAAASFASGSTVYRIEYVFVPAVGENFHVAFELTAESIMGS